MLTWTTLDDWHYQVSLELRAALNSCGRKAAALHRAMLQQGRPVRTSSGSFQNALTPSTDTHHLRLDEFWGVLDLINNKPVLHSVCRQLDLLIAPSPLVSEDPQADLLGAFSERNGELAETQHLLVSVINRTTKESVDGARQSLLREIYEDFCESLSLLFKLEQACLARQGGAPVNGDADWRQRYDILQSSVQAKLQNLKEHGTCLQGLSNRVLSAALESDGCSQLSAPNFLKLLFLDQSRSVAKAFAESLGYRLGPLPLLNWQPERQDLIQSYSQLESRQADTAEKISKALRDQQITQAELSEIYQELVDEHQAQVSLVMNSGALPYRPKHEEF
ncbi:phage regulatory CII family protein [Marinobacter sp.]|uniref:phage regulatory CII family protein n=1 Tax=Marinobacter sp. TaxID=50741 RepID=UPI003A9411F0